MKLNMHPWDRLFRLIAALAAFLLVLTEAFKGTWAIAADVAAVILFVTAVFGFCPLYALSTRKLKE